MTTHLPPPLELLRAYALGFFPMPDLVTQEIHWYKPEMRAILPLDGFHCSKSFRRFMKTHLFEITVNQSFSEVMQGCSERAETWINSEFKRAYQELHQLGHCHSVEIWNQKSLVGGVYGVQLGGAFFAESMFSRTANASKLALYSLCQHLIERGFLLLEVQFLTDHLESLGAIEVTDETYEAILSKALALPSRF